VIEPNLDPKIRYGSLTILLIGELCQHVFVATI